MKQRSVLMESMESRTLMSATPVVLPRPTDLAASVSGLNVTLTWHDNSSNETGFGIFRLGKAGFTQIARVDANVTTYVDKGAPIGGDAYVVRALKGDAKSEGSNAVTVTVKAPVVLKAPTKLKSEALSKTSIKLSWEGDTGATGGYRIEMALSADNWVAVGSAAPGVRTFTHTGLTAGTRYYYRIVALGEGGTTANSAIIIAQTKSGDGK